MPVCNCNLRKSRHLFLLAACLSVLVAAPPAVAASSEDLASLAAAPETLTPGQFIWADPPAMSDQPLSVTIDLDEQIAWVYRGDTLIGMSTISSGRLGHETPTGSFTILQKSLTHKSNLYDDAPMPFMQRLTWDGVALHAGSLPGHPASHGCIHLPRAFAKLLYHATRIGTTVTITGETPALATDKVEITAAEPEIEPPLNKVSLPYALSER